MNTTPSPVISPPWLIQGGMGIAISNWRLARAVASAGQLGVVSGTAIDTVFVRRLQDHGVDDVLRGVLDKFPVPSIVEDALHRFAGVRRRAGTPYKSLAMLTERSPRRAFDLVVLASFVEVALAKLGHRGQVGINLLDQSPDSDCRVVVRGHHGRSRLRDDGSGGAYPYPRRDR